MKIYTKTGDKGTTALFGGTRLPKHHIRIESYGTVDELNSFIGLVRDHLTQQDVRSELKIIQETLFTIGSHLAADPSKENLWIPEIEPAEVELLEKGIDRMEASLPSLKNFILPGGHPVVSYCHVVRCVCRRAERNVVALGESEEVAPILSQYLNRLSDYFFVLARFVGKELGAKEVVWESR
ncbi:MAG: cob(I)yrinic acid a,c-diamide adenosyltransferase [Bacteroidota bacterium]